MPAETRIFLWGCGACATGTRTVVRRVSSDADPVAHLFDQHPRVLRLSPAFLLMCAGALIGAASVRFPLENGPSFHVKRSRLARCVRACMTRHRCRCSQNGCTRTGRWQQVRTAENSAAASAGRCVSAHRPRRDRWSTECLEDASAPTKDVAKVYRFGSPVTFGGTPSSWAPARGRADAVC